MSTETTHEGQTSGSNGKAQRPGTGERSGGTNWEQFFHEHGWIAEGRIHCPDELIFEMRFADGHSLVVYPATAGHEELAPAVQEGVLVFKNGTDHFYYPWGMLSSLITKLNPRRTKTVQGREYAVDQGEGYERRLKNTADLVLEPAVPEGPKTVAGTVHTPEQGQEGTPGRRQFSTIDPNAPSWSAGGSDSDE